MADEFSSWLRSKGIKDIETIQLCRDAWDQAHTIASMNCSRAIKNTISQEREGCALECLEISESFESDPELSAVAKICRTKILLRGVKI